MKQFVIAEPCHENWNHMRSAGGARHCASCDKHVVDLAAMTAAEVRGLVMLTGGSFCGRQVVRDGELVLMPEPRRRSPFALRSIVGGAIVATALGAAACQPVHAGSPEPREAVPVLVAQVDPGPARAPEPQPDPVVIEEDPGPMMGKIAMPRPTVEDLDVQFRDKSARLARGMDSKLSEVANAIKSSPWIVAVSIDGSVTRDELGTKALALARAEVVKQALVKLGVAAGRLRTTGVGVGRRGVGFHIVSDEGSPE